MKILSLAAITFAFLLTACVVEEPRGGGYYVHPVQDRAEHWNHHQDDHDDWNDDDDQGHRYHCPPGQAKKGNC